MTESEKRDKYGYDLAAALENNSVPAPEDFEVLASVLSEHHDEGEYFWGIQCTDTQDYFVITGSHDYTGWECQSGANITNPFKSLDKLHLNLPEYDNQNRPIRKLVKEQLDARV